MKCGTRIDGGARPIHMKAEFALYVRYDHVIYLCRDCLANLKVKNLKSQRASALNFVNEKVLDSTPLPPASGGPQKIMINKASGRREQLAAIRHNLQKIAEDIAEVNG